MTRRRISIAFMILTIGTIGAFQAYWLWKNYTDEKKSFSIRTNLIFRETVFKLQALKLHLDTSFHIRTEDKSGVISMTNVLREKVVPDSSGKLLRTKSFVISVHHDPLDGNADSSHNVLYNLPNAQVLDILTGLDSLQGVLTVQELTDSYRQRLTKEGIDLPFHITTSPGKKTDGEAEDFFPSDANGNKVRTGFAKPVIFELGFDHAGWYVIRRIAPQALFSLVLVGFTIASFWLLYRNWQQQRRLTQLKNDFIGNMTHELKTPIATVSVAVEALQHFNALQDPGRTREYLDISANELQRLSLMVDKVLKLSLFEMKEIELKKENFDLKHLLEEVMLSMRLQFEKYQVNPQLDFRGTDFSMNADKLHISSVIFNLFDNALKYGSADPKIEVSLSAEQEQLLFSVKDNGIGISPVYKEKIFDKFFRVPSGDKHNVKGYGLGLSYASYVVQRHGGRITVESRLAAGSCFTVKIPRNHV